MFGIGTHEGHLLHVRKHNIYTYIYTAQPPLIPPIIFYHICRRRSRHYIFLFMYYYCYYIFMIENKKVPLEKKKYICCCQLVILTFIDGKKNRTVWNLLPWRRIATMTCQLWGFPDSTTGQQPFWNRVFFLFLFFWSHFGVYIPETIFPIMFFDYLNCLFSVELTAVPSTPDDTALIYQMNFLFVMFVHYYFFFVVVVFFIIPGAI